MMEYKILLLVLCQSVLVFSVPLGTTESLITVSKDIPDELRQKETSNEQSEKKIPKISSMNVETNVTNRFAKTLVTSRVKNSDEKAQEVTFSVILPETAYISGFIMEIDGKQYEAYVQEKEEAKKTYDNAVSSGIAAGHVALNARDSNRFTVSVNIEPESKATFYLTYEELLKRENGQYEIVLNLHPGQPIKDLNVQVNINETRPLTFVKAPSLRSGNEISKNEEKLDPKAQIEFIGNQSAKVVFKPDEERQKELAKNMGTKESDGLAGQFIVQYDVERDPSGGEILVSDGYFVHFFAPSDLEPLPKHVVFVLDTSGSMWGTRIQQLKEAMKSILKQLKEKDSFNIIDFNSGVNVWNVPEVTVQYEEIYDKKSSNPIPGSFEVSKKNIEQAEKVIDKLQPTGGTNIASALSLALKLIAEHKSKDERQPIIMFLTDGEPSEGIVDINEIVSKISKENKDSVPLFSLSFGAGADRSFLEKLSLRNQGFARHIYEGADASLQLESFYKYISSPLLNNIKFEYVSNSTSGVTRTHYPIFFDGSELVVAGRYPIQQIDPGFYPTPNTPLDPGFAPLARCFAGTIPKDFKPQFENPVGSLEKHWAYLTLNQILEERDAADNKTELTKKALDIALKYSFVTPVSSLVVVKPNNTKDEANPEDASKDSNNRYPVRMGMAGGFPQSPLLFGAPMSSSVGAGGAYAMHALSLPAYDLSSARFPMKFYPSTTFNPQLYTSSAPQTTEILVDNVDKLKQFLPWLVDNLNAGNNTLKLQQGEFIIDTQEKIQIDQPQCTNAPLQGNGTCVLLRECPKVYNILTDLQTYTKHFCPLKEFAGVCCPVESDAIP